MSRTTSPVEKLILDLAGAPVTTSAWVQLSAATTQPASSFQIYNGSGSVLKISTGAAAAEDAAELPYYIIPGQTSPIIPIEVSKGKRISLKAADADATDGSFVMNLFG